MRNTPKITRPELGRLITFTPSAFSTGEGKEPIHTPDGLVPVTVTGEIVEINAAHRWYRVRFECFGNVLNECFKY